MKMGCEKDKFPFRTDLIQLTSVFYVDLIYTQNHAHTLHQHKDVLELLYVYSGEGRYWVGDRAYAVREGDIIICDANTLHGETAFLENTIETYCAALTGISIPNLPDNCLVRKNHKPVVQLTRFKDVVKKLMPHIYDMHVLKEYDLSKSLAISLLMMVYREMQTQELDENSHSTARTEMMVREIKKYLDEHYTEQLQMEDICRKFHISASHLSHLFKREIGIAPKQYIVMRRIGEAQTLLAETDIPVQEMEEKLGFGSSCHLSSTFKKYVGISPQKFRKHFREDSL